MEEDNWFLQIEAFDPHEPFYTQKEYKRLYPDDYHGKNLDWPDYGKNEYGKEATKHVRYEYAALLSMCDRYLGRVLDMMDHYDMWKDTMLIVNTDYGFMPVSYTHLIKFTGLTNYLKLFKDDWFIVSFRNNILFTAVTVPVLLVLGLILADLINRHMSVSYTHLDVYKRQH